jgi:cytochrome c-type biogenesis protein
MKKIILLFLLIFVLLSISISAELPIGLQKINEYNNEIASDFLLNVSFFLAFLAGITSIFSPCILPLLPAYFAITFKEKKRITLATLFFFIGFALMFVLMGLLATLTGKTLSTLFSGVTWLVPAAGVLLLIIGTMIVLGKGFPGFNVHNKIQKDWKGLILAGLLFALGWSACVGPLISGVLLMAATFQNYLTSSLLMLFYALGLFLPLFILSFFYDKYDLGKSKFLSKRVEFTLLTKKINTTYPNLISGILFMILGVVFIIYRGTSIVNGLQFFGLKQNFYDWQNYFIAHSSLFSWVGGVVLVIFLITLYYFVKKKS